MSELETARDGRIKRIGIGIVVAAVVVIATLFIGRKLSLGHEQKVLAAEQAKGDFVRVAPVKLSPPERDLVLQAETLPYAQTTLYAKIAGYLDRISVDKGDRVKAGQVLAILRSPETDSAYQGLEADAKNKEANRLRSDSLFAQKLISLQDHQQAETDARVAQEALASQAAQKGYQVFKAPFDGVVTARYADPGALFQTGNGAQPLVTVAQIQRLRVEIFVDQRVAPYVKTGDALSITPEGRTDLKLPAIVSRTSGALDPSTRMLLVEADLDNRNGQVLPGGFATATLHLKVPARLEIPAEAVLVRGDKTLVAVVDGENRVRFKTVTLGDEEQQRYAVLDGLQAGEQVATNLGADAQEGDKVQPVTQ